MFEMDLDHVGCVPAVRQHRRLEGDRADRRVAPPIRIALAAIARPDAQIIERVAPATLALEGQMSGIETIGLDRADGVRAGLVELISRPIKRHTHYMTQIVLVDPDLLL